MSSSFCSSCKIELQNDDTIRAHYRSEFHHYNIKRKLVNLPPISLDQFNSKKAQLMAESSQSEKDQLYRCELCGKSFASKATYKQHLESKKHRENLRKFNEKKIFDSEEDEKKEQRSSVNTDEDQTVCLFCNKKSSDIDENLVHMRLAHSFFISNLKNVKDLPGLLKYLGEKVHKKFTCINCGNETTKEGKSGEGVQRHMLDKGHIFMDTENFAEYERFYDYIKVLREMYKDNLIEGTPETINEEDEYLEIHVEENGSGSEEEGEWEVIDEDKSKEETRGQQGKKRVFRIKKAKLLDSGEVLLPNGQLLGNRKYKTIYKQYYRETMRQNLMELQSIGYSEESVLAAREEETRLQALNDNELRKEILKNETQIHKYQTKKGKEGVTLGVKGNKNLQPHFRRQLYGM